MADSTTAPQGNPGDILNWPMLKVNYRTDAECIAKLLPPGLSVGDEPIVRLTFYNFPVQGLGKIKIFINFYELSII